MDEKEFLMTELNRLPGVFLDEHQAGQLLMFYQLLNEKNKVMNLTRVTDFQEALKKHFADSLAIGRCMDMSRNLKILDLGSGGGFPGIPIKIVWPDTEVVMIDSVGKKIGFLNEVIEKLQLPKASALHVRAEDLGHDPEYREMFDLCVSRAVADASVLAEYCLPFVKTGGYFIAYKSGDSGEEIRRASRAITVLGGDTAELFPFELYELKRILVKVAKIHPAPKKYPRKAGIPSKEPIGGPCT